ncbi:MAG: PIN domain-containing protein [Candidatus Accumulibacter sp.]|nr:PIN domain-containing protein [Accumulibacter sp.]
MPLIALRAILPRLARFSSRRQWNFSLAGCCAQGEKNPQEELKQFSGGRWQSPWRRAVSPRPWDTLALSSPGFAGGNERFNGYIAPHSLTNIFYILRHAFPAAQRRDLFPGLCMLFGAVEVNEEKIIAAIHKENFADFEDCLQAECAEYVGADVTTVTPEEFLKNYVE